MEEKELPEYLGELLKKILEESKPVSIFLYGSMARDDFENDSDYEIGVVYKKDKKWSRQKLEKLFNYKNVKVYPFVEEELSEGEIDTPFPKEIYLQTLLKKSLVLYGERLENIIKNKKINKDDLLESVGFCLGRAYCAVVSSRQNDLISVRDNFTKSALYGLQILIFIKTRDLVFSYKEMMKKSDDLLPDEYKELITHVIEVRKGNVVVDNSLLYKNISFLNKVVLKAIKNL
jgi:predicted nucleotidyltransferase